MKEETKGILLGAGFALLLVSSGFTAGYLTRGWMGSSTNGYPLVEEGEQHIRDHFYGEIPESIAMQRGMLKGLVDTLGDRHTVFLEPTVHELETDNLAGEYGGIGVRLTMDETGKVQIDPFEDSPAMEFGIAPGSFLLQVDSWSVTSEASLPDIEAALRGPEGSRVQVTVQDPVDQEVQTYEIERRNFPIPAVSEYVLSDFPKVGIIQITLFSERVVDEVSSALKRLREMGITALIIDLRGNSGGFIDRGLDLAETFLSEGVVFVETDRDGNQDVFEVREGSQSWEKPVVVLIDGGTASASETFAAAMQYHDRAILIGEQSFGKSSIQLVFELSDGSSLRVTASRWLTPDLSDIEGIGLAPNITVTQNDPEIDTALYAAIQELDVMELDTP